MKLYTKTVMTVIIAVAMVLSTMLLISAAAKGIDILLDGPQNREAKEKRIRNAKRLRDRPKHPSNTEEEKKVILKLANDIINGDE